ncbi:flavin reductase [Steroidobacter flavus]|uniref:Flavin reductase n=1 Tax=Steroidobacter flavus TaxID=1842136 RepID=A0ABV8SXB4_9GAMM
MSLDSKAFRGALGAFATGVTIVTTIDADGNDVGLTANSFNSVSLDPPLVLWSLAKTSLSLGAFSAAPHFAVHILAADQEALSNKFAKRGVDKFSGVDVQRGEGGIPLLTGCGARFQCRTAYQYDGGDHVIFVGEVLQFDHSQRVPLLFHGGRYAMPASPAIADEAVATECDEDLSHLVQRAYFHLLTPVRRERERLGISLQEHYMLSVLMAVSDRSVEEVDTVIAYTGIRATQALAEGLAARGLIEVFQPDGKRALRLTARGRECVTNLLAAAKAVEAEALRPFKREERNQLKSLLRELLSRAQTSADEHVTHHMTLLGQLFQDTGTITQHDS